MSGKTWLYLFALCILIISLQAFAYDGKWEKIDVPAYRIGTIAEITIGYNPSDQRIILAASASDSGWLWMSTNDGQSWIRNHYVQGERFHTRVVIQEDDFDEYGAGWTLVASQSGNTDQYAGPYRTVNGAANWVLKADDADLDNFKMLYALAADQSSASLQAAFIGGEGNSQNSYKRLFRTTDGGTNWDRKENGLPANAAGTVYDIAICHDFPNYMYCAYEGNSNGPAVYRSMDGGESWDGLNITHETRTAQSARAIAVHPTHNEIVAVIENEPISGQVWVSTNATDSDPYWIDKGCLPTPEINTNSMVFSHNYWEPNPDPDRDVRFQAFIAYSGTELDEQRSEKLYPWAREFEYR